MYDNSINGFSNQYNQIKAALQKEGNANPSSAEIIAKMNKDVSFKGKQMPQGEPVMKYAPPMPQKPYNDQYALFNSGPRMVYAPPTPQSVPQPEVLAKYAPPMPDNVIEQLVTEGHEEIPPYTNMKYAPPTPQPGVCAKYAPPIPGTVSDNVIDELASRGTVSDAELTPKPEIKKGALDKSKDFIKNIWGTTKKAFVKIKDFVVNIFKHTK